MFDSLKKLIYKVGLYLPGGERRLVNHLKLGGGGEKLVAISRFTEPLRLLLMRRDRGC